VALFKISARREDGVEKEFLYDNINSRLMTVDGVDIVPHDLNIETSEAFAVSEKTPAIKTSPKTLKISLGLSCNYSCEYCSQRFVPHEGETTKDDIGPFMAGLDKWVKTPPEVVEFWGGEPLVYVKTLKPLAEALRAKYPEIQFVMITNGSLLNPEINQWLDEMEFSIGLSHDATGQHVRGPDPFQDEDSKNGIIDLYSRLKPKGKISFNTMMHRGNQSRAEVQKFWVERFGPTVNIGEGAFIDPYDEGGFSSSLQSSQEQVAYRIQAFKELRSGSVANFDIVISKMNDFLNSIRSRRNAFSLGQKCGMDKEDKIAVDLNGNVLTCQNVSSTSTSMNGQAHKIGHVSQFDEIKLNTATHWSKRESCQTCPVLQLCKGSCMFLEGPLWDAGCDNSYSDNIPYFAGTIERVTGFMPYRVEHESLPEDRMALWSIKEKPRAKEFPIPVVAA
jgi:uncharacterized protein